MKHENYSVTPGSLNLSDVLRGERAGSGGAGGWRAGDLTLMIVMHGGRAAGRTPPLTGASSAM